MKNNETHFTKFSILIIALLVSLIGLVLIKNNPQFGTNASNYFKEVFKSSTIASNDSKAISSQLKDSSTDLLLGTSLAGQAEVLKKLATTKLNKKAYIADTANNRVVVMQNNRWEKELNFEAGVFQLTNSAYEAQFKSKPKAASGKLIKSFTAGALEYFNESMINKGVE